MKKAVQEAENITGQDNREEGGEPVDDIRRAFDLQQPLYPMHHKGHLYWCLGAFDNNSVVPATKLAACVQDGTWMHRNILQRKHTCQYGE